MAVAIRLLCAVFLSVKIGAEEGTPQPHPAPALGPATTLGGAPGVRMHYKGRRPQKWLGRRLEEVTKAVGGGYCRLQMPLKLAVAVRGTVAGHRLGALGGPLPMHPCPGDLPSTQAGRRQQREGERSGWPLRISEKRSLGEFGPSFGRQKPVCTSVCVQDGAENNRSRERPQSGAIHLTTEAEGCGASEWWSWAGVCAPCI